MSRKPFYLLIFFLFAAGMGYNLQRHLDDGIPLLPGSSQVTWTVEARVTFTGEGPVELSLALPTDPAYQILSESAASPGYGLAVDTQGEARRAVWTSRNARGNQDLYYTANLVPTGNEALEFRDPIGSDAEVIWDEGLNTAAEAVLEEAWSKSANNRSFARELARAISQPEKKQNIALLLSRYEPARLMARLLRSADVSAQLVWALKLEDGRRRQKLVELVEVLDGERWILFNPTTGEQGRQEDMLLWQRHGSSVLDLAGGRNSNVTFSIIKDTRPALATAMDLMAKERFASLSLYNLPLEEQSLLRGLFLVPVGVLVVVFLRVLIGLKTSGTFMPVLIALAFIQTKLLTGLIGFLLIVAAGLVIRSYLSNLNLLLISRISAVVIVVLGIIAGFTLLAFNLGLTEGLTITFFPMIILAWTIERMSILWEEEGAKEVFVQGGGSLLVAVITYLAMDNAMVMHWAYNFLGTHLVILALVLLMGQYTGYRLLELRRFKPLARD